jgi:hypothetical protein
LSIIVTMALFLRVIEKAIDNPGTMLRLILALARAAGLWILIQNLT